MSKPNYTHLILIMDASGSMRSSIASVRRSTLAFLEAQSKIDGDLTVTVNIFDDDVTRRLKHFLSIEEAKLFVDNNCHAGGATALFDAVGHTAEQTAAKLLELAPEHQPEKIIFAIITDGCDSGYGRLGHTAASVKVLVDYYEGTYDWEFLFIGSNQNAYRTGKLFGIKAGKALSFAASSKGFKEAMNAVCGAVTRYRLNGAPNANEFFSTADHDYQEALGAQRSPGTDN